MYLTEEKYLAIVLLNHIAKFYNIYPSILLLNDLV